MSDDKKYCVRAIKLIKKEVETEATEKLLKS